MCKSWQPNNYDTSAIDISVTIHRCDLHRCALWRHGCEAADVAEVDGHWLEMFRFHLLASLQLLSNWPTSVTPAFSWLVITTGTGTSIYWHSCGPKAEQLEKKQEKVLKHVNNTINLNEQHDLTWFQWFPQLYIVFCVLVLWVWRLFFLCFILFYVIFLGRLLGCTSTLSHLSYAVCSCTLCCMRSWQINDDDNDNERNKDQIQQIRTDSFFSAFVPNNFSYFVCLLSALSDVLSCYMLFFLSHLFVQFAIVFFVTYERWHHYLR